MVVLSGLVSLSHLNPTTPISLTTSPPHLSPPSFFLFLLPTLSQNHLYQGKPLMRNQVNVLKLGATTAARKGKGSCNVAHFRKLNVPMGPAFVRRMAQFDQRLHRQRIHRKSEEHKSKVRIQRGRAFANHAVGLQSREASLYKKDGFGDHSYSKSNVEE